MVTNIQAGRLDHVKVGAYALGHTCQAHYTLHNAKEIYFGNQKLAQTSKRDIITRANTQVASVTSVPYL